MKSAWLTSVRILAAGAVLGGALFYASGAAAGPFDSVNSFQRVGTFFVDTQAEGTGAEIIAATKDGMTVIYTDALEGKVGFVDITDPSNPTFIKTLTAPAMGEPTSVATTPDGRWALVTVLGDENLLWIIDLSDNTSETTIPLGGEPDSVAISPNGRYAAIAIENEESPSVPGFLTIVDIVGAPTNWGLRTVNMVGVADRLPEDPEPEFIDINNLNIAAVTLQENNHIVLVSLPLGFIINDFSAGTSTHAADLTNSSPDNADFSETLVNARREPDGIAWTPAGFLATANEGDSGALSGGRDFTIFSGWSQLMYQSRSSLERAIADAGHYDDGRSDDSGVEPEGMKIATFNNKTFMFVGGERCGCVAVYELLLGFLPRFVQVLDVGLEPGNGNERPEGLLAIPSRNIFISANEGDEGDPPGTIAIFQGVRRTFQLRNFAED